MEKEQISDQETIITELDVDRSQATKETREEADEARETEHLKKIEASLFVSGKWLSLPDLVSLTDLNPILLRQLIDKLSERYLKEESAISIICKDDMWKMDVKEEYANIVTKLATGDSEFTKAEQETLAVIAYKQPVKQSVVIKIRGNKAYEHIKKFISLGMIKSKAAGHTLEIHLSDDFYNYFHVRNPEDEISDRPENYSKEFSGVRNPEDEEMSQLKNSNTGNQEENQ